MSGLIIESACPNCQTVMTFPDTAVEVVCPKCKSRFALADEPTAKEQMEAVGAVPAEPPAPVEPPAPAEPPEPTPPEPLSTGVEALDKALEGGLKPEALAGQPAAAEAEEDEDDPKGAGDVTTPADRRRGGGRKPIVLAPKGEGVTDFIHKTREYQWVAKGGIGNPYGPTSVSTIIFGIIAASGEAGIDPVDLAVALRQRLLDSKRDCRSILQRIVMVCERVCCNPSVSIMERVGDTDRIRISAKHNVKVPIPPSDMVGTKRRKELETQRLMATALEQEPAEPPAP